MIEKTIFPREEKAEVLFDKILSDKCGRSEIPMSSVSSRTPVDFLLRIWGMRSS